MKRKNKGDVQWLAPNQKKPIAYSTKAASDIIVALAQQQTTIQDVHDAITYDFEAKSIMRKYIVLGFGNNKAKEMFN